MAAFGRSAVTLVVLGAIVLLWAVYGFAQVSKPFPGKADVPTCVDIAVPKGGKVRPGDVTVSVLNAGTRAGLAARTMQLFLDAGFGRGDSGNAPEGTKVAYAQVWSSDADDPAVRLVTSRVSGSRVVDQPTSAAGITIVVGDDFTQLTEGRPAIKARQDTVVCGPPTD